MAVWVQAIFEAEWTLRKDFCCRLINRQATTGWCVELKIVGGWKKIECVSSLPPLFLLFPRHPDLTDAGDRLLCLVWTSSSALMFSWLHPRLIETYLCEYCCPDETVEMYLFWMIIFSSNCWELLFVNTHIPPCSCFGDEEAGNQIIKVNVKGLLQSL